MRSAWLWSAPTLVLSVLVGCGGTSDGSVADGGANNAGSGGSAGSAGTNHGGAGTTNGGGAGDASLGECEKSECGPQLGLPNWTCADGSVGGPTGRCLERPGGTCGWEINNCPMAGEGGASNQGGQGNAAGDATIGGAASDACGGCDASKICVFQIGGPGPSHFNCAMQNPCGSAAACACIVGQGTCKPDLMGEPPGYCSCDNGLQ